MNPEKGIRVLSVCDDDGIRFSREMVLKFEGYEVESVRSTEPLDPAQIRSFHIAVMCHSISAQRASEIASRFRRYNPDMRIVRVHAIRSSAEHVYDVDCEVLPGPGQLLSGIRALAGQIRSHHESAESAHNAQKPVSWPTGA